MMRQFRFLLNATPSKFYSTKKAPFKLLMINVKVQGPCKARYKTMEHKLKMRENREQNLIQNINSYTQMLSSLLIKKSLFGKCPSQPSIRVQNFWPLSDMFTRLRVVSNIQNSLTTFRYRAWNMWNKNQHVMCQYFSFARIYWTRKRLMAKSWCFL